MVKHFGSDNLGTFFVIVNLPSVFKQKQIEIVKKAKNYFL